MNFVPGQGGPGGGRKTKGSRLPPFLHLLLGRKRPALETATRCDVGRRGSRDESSNDFAKKDRQANRRNECRGASCCSESTRLAHWWAETCVVVTIARASIGAGSGRWCAAQQESAQDPVGLTRVCGSECYGCLFRLHSNFSDRMQGLVVGIPLRLFVGNVGCGYYAQTFCE